MVGHGVLLAEKNVCLDWIVVLRRSCVREKRIERGVERKMNLTLIAKKYVRVCVREREREMNIYV